LRVLTQSKQLTSLPGNTRRARRREALLVSATEADLLEETQLLVLAADNLDELKSRTRRERAPEAEGRQDVHNEPCRDGICLLQDVVRDATPYEARRRHLRTRERGEEVRSRPRGGI
jgi:hypothetical protein